MGCRVWGLGFRVWGFRGTLEVYRECKKIMAFLPRALEMHVFKEALMCHTPSPSSPNSLRPKTCWHGGFGSLRGPHNKD